jgi:hypothetical protein
MRGGRMSGFAPVGWSAVAALGSLLVLAAALSGSQVIRHATQSGPLAERAAWASREAGASPSGAARGYWVGYSIRRLMGERSQFCMHGDFASNGEPTLDELIYGHRTLVERRAANAVPLSGGDGRPERKVFKEVALLLLYDSPAAKKPSAVSASNLVFSVSLGGRPLYWLGPAEDGESVRFLQGFFAAADPEEFRSSVVRAIALHRRPDLVVPFLERIVAGREPEAIRADAAAFLGDQPDPRALEILKRTASSDASPEVRESAVAGLVELELPGAADALIDFARRGRDEDVRREAIRGLAEKAIAAAISTLEQLAYEDKNVEIRKDAIEALADLPDKTGLPYVIKAAKTHPDREARIAAIEALGEFHDPAAQKALIEIIKNR